METEPLKTRWTPEDPPLGEYPRPQMMRERFLNLNGHWKYAITASDLRPTEFDGFILVPYSPESLLSGVGKVLRPGQILHYVTTFNLPEDYRKGRVLLHFGAVDMDSIVYVNGKEAGSHKGGYNAFTFDVTTLLQSGENEIWVAVSDDTDLTGRTRAKQTFKRGGIWYTPSSGIWQTVWLEPVPEHYISNLKITPDFDGGRAQIKLMGDYGFPVSVKVFQNNKLLKELMVPGDTAEIELNDFIAWSPEHPTLYDVEITAGLDTVKTYFGMRKFEIKEDCDGNKRFFLNGKPYFMHGLLDQGYFSDGMYTAPTDEALYNDIIVAKRLGYNTLRKHIKVEPLRWYYHCDRLGMLVWQDMPSGGERYKMRTIQIYPFLGLKLNDRKYGLFGRENKLLRQEFLNEYKEMLSALYNVTSLAMWVPFNEGWGQFDAKRIADETKRYDPTRLVDHASGWHDQGGADFLSLHIYFRRVPKVVARKRAVIVSEFGGYSHRVEGHSFNRKTFGYKVFKTEEELNAAFETLYINEVIPRIKEGLSADIYTQLSDVEDEVNGLITYDRNRVKILEETAERVRSAICKEVANIKTK